MFAADPSFNLEEEVVVGCGSSGELVQCRLSHPQCYNRTDTCIYDTKLVDQHQNLVIQTACRDGSHLRIDCGQ